MITVGFIGFGEAASSIAEGLLHEGIKKVLAFDALLEDPLLKDETANRIRTMGVKPVSLSSVVSETNVIFSAVPSYHAVAVTIEAAKHLAANSLYVDVTTATPQEKKQIADIIRLKGSKFIDGAMMGSLPKYKHRVPMLISGDGINLFYDAMKPYKMNLTKIDETPGSATCIKFVRSIVAKGLACLLIEALNAANKFGIEETIFESICEIFGTDAENTIDRLVSSTLTHASRRSHEMQNVVGLLQQAGVCSTMSEASKSKLEWIDALDIKSRFDHGVPDTWRQIIQNWDI